MLSTLYLLYVEAYRKKTLLTIGLWYTAKESLFNVEYTGNYIYTCWQTKVTASSVTKDVQNTRSLLLTL